MRDIYLEAATDLIQLDVDDATRAFAELPEAGKDTAAASEQLERALRRQLLHAEAGRQGLLLDARLEGFRAAVSPGERVWLLVGMPGRPAAGAVAARARRRGRRRGKAGARPSRRRTRTRSSSACRVCTLAGQQDISQQLLDRSAPGFDAVLYADMRGAYDAQLDSQLLVGSGSAGQHLGVRNVTNKLTTSYTDGTPTAAEMLPKVYDAIQRSRPSVSCPPTSS
jgi:hypothetical protein